MWKTMREWWDRLTEPWRPVAPPVAPKVRKARATMGRINCPDCGRMVAFSCETLKTAAHYCGDKPGMTQRKIDLGWTPEPRS